MQPDIKHTRPGAIVSPVGFLLALQSTLVH